MPHWSGSLRFPQDIDPATFLERHWQKEPLLMRGALPPGGPVLDPDELAGLALEPDVEARLITHDGSGNFTLLESPFAESEFTRLPARDWTLLVQDVEKHLPDLAGFLDLFDFLPSWRRDDLMISAAAPGGGVGPHIDEYDVFLCQLSGRRRWRIGAPGEFRERADTALRQIEDFPVREELTLEPGDVLYLPPGVPHDGIALDLCTTWSAGFRAPSQYDLAEAFCPQHAGSASESMRYKDPDLRPGEAADGLISGAAVRRFRGMLEAFASLDEVALTEGVGRFLTRPKAWLEPQPPAVEILPDDLEAALREGDRLLRHGMALLARARAEHCSWLFASGRAFMLGEQDETLARLICARRSVSFRDLGPLADFAGTFEMLASLYNTGQVLLSRDLDEFQSQKR